MLQKYDLQNSFNQFFTKIRLVDKNQQSGKDKTAKIGQILSYLDIINAQVGKYSKNKELVFIDCGAGNCYLSFLVYFYYSSIDARPIQIHCLDTNQKLMDKNRERAKNLGFERMFFHTSDISDYVHEGRPDMVYSLHACDDATDKTLFLGIETNAKNILSVSCCQHTIVNMLKGRPYTGLTRHQLFKNKLAYMIGDSLRALLLEMHGYKTDIIEFASSRYTEKNIMLRAKKSQINNNDKLRAQYRTLQETFKIHPALEGYLGDPNQE